MRRSTAVLAVTLLAGTAGGAWGQTKPPPSQPRPAESKPGMNRDAGDISICVVEGGSLHYVPVLYDVVTGDTTMSDGRLFAEAYPTDARYAAGADWYINNEVVRFGLAPLGMLKHGVPVVFRIDQLMPVGSYRGVTVFAEVGSVGKLDIIYLPLRPGCEFQPYWDQV